MDPITIPEYAKQVGVSRIAAFRQFKRLKALGKELPGVASHTKAGRTHLLTPVESAKKVKIKK